MNLLVNFATESHYRAQQFNSITGLQIGCFDEVYECSLNQLDPSFAAEYKHILDQSRGAGYWIWKPFFILKALTRLQIGDCLMYCDSGSHFINSAIPLINLTHDFNQDIIPFELEAHLLEKFWTKRDAFVLMRADEASFTNTPQRLASFIVVKKSKYSIDFFNSYLNYCKNEYILTDINNSSGFKNYDGFIEHRHDQSIFSLLSKKHRLECFRDPSQWGNPRISKFSNSAYPQILEHTRQKNPKHARPFYRIKRYFKDKIFKNTL